MKLLLGIMSGEHPRYNEFESCVDALIMPVASLKMRAHGSSPAQNFNQIVTAALQNEAEFVAILDDDHQFAPDTAMKLMAHNKDIVSALYLMRRFPFQPVLFDQVDELGLHRWKCLKDGESGLIECTASGTGFLMMKTEVFKTIPPPWSTLGGKNYPDHWNNDVNLFNYLSQFGIKFHCDLDTPLWHSTACHVAPARNGKGEWSTVISVMGQGANAACRIEIEKAKYLPEEKKELVEV